MTQSDDKFDEQDILSVYGGTFDIGQNPLAAGVSRPVAGPVAPGEDDGLAVRELPPPPRPVRPTRKPERHEPSPEEIQTLDRSERRHDRTGHQDSRRLVPQLSPKVPQTSSHSER